MWGESVQEYDEDGLDEPGVDLRSYSPSINADDQQCGEYEHLQCLFIDRKMSTLWFEDVQKFEFFKFEQLLW